LGFCIVSIRSDSAEQKTNPKREMTCNMSSLFTCVGLASRTIILGGTHHFWFVYYFLFIFCYFFLFSFRVADW